MLFNNVWEEYSFSFIGTNISHNKTLFQEATLLFLLLRNPQKKNLKRKIPKKCFRPSVLDTKLI